MKNTLFILSILSFYSFGNDQDFIFTNPSKDNQIKPADEVFVFSYVKDEKKLNLNWKIQENYYLYLDSVKVKKNENYIDFKIITANIIEYSDEFFGKTKIIRNSLEISFDDEQNSSDLRIMYQGCADKGFCYPVQVKDLK